MDSIQKSKLSMGMATRDYCLPNTAITTPLPNFQTNFTTVQNTIPQIQAIAELQDFDKTGIAENKGQLKTTLCVLSDDYSRKLTTFAKFTNNTLLLREVKISATELKRCADADLKTKAQELYDRAQTNLAALATYGITAATQTTLQTAITAFNTAIPKPRLGINERKQATEQLAVLFKSVDAALANMDSAVEIIRLTQPNFYNGYKNARKIIETGSNTLAVKGKVIDAINGEPLKNAIISFVLTGDATMMKTTNGNGKLTKKTAAKGGFMVKSLAEGTYQVTISKPGYKDQIITVNISNGEMSELNIGLDKI